VPPAVLPLFVLRPFVNEAMAIDARATCECLADDQGLEVVAVAGDFDMRARQALCDGKPDGFSQLRLAHERSL
jgi:hypothetical protein